MIVITVSLIFWIVLASFVMESIDSVLGGGFGTVLSPLLILAGFEPLVVVPSILLSEIFTGFSSGYFNNKFKNVDLIHDEQASTSLKILMGTGIVGSLFAVFLGITFDPFVVKMYIAVLVIMMGLLVLFYRSKNGSFSKKKILGLGLLSSFNKGISGGGYGPIIVSGQVLSGLNSKASVAVTSVSEAVTCICGLLLYFLSGAFYFSDLTVSICIGAFLATPFSAVTISKIKHKNLSFMIGVATLTIGIYTLMRLVGLL